MALLEVISVSKAFAGTPVLRDVSLRADDGEIVCLLGPSGCGKTTLLRIVAGLETADRGEVTFDGRPFDEVPAHRRGFGLMFQDYALFPHKDVVANVAFGLRMQDLPRAQVQTRVAEMLDLVGLAGYEHRRVYDLSGGEQQRVALARSLAPGPRLLMLDEPLGSLDRALREELMNELRAILNRVGVTAIYVTHDQEEAFAVADRVIIMHQGRIVQQGVPQAVYRHPASPGVARFLGLSNLIPGRVVALEPGAGQRPLLADGRSPTEDLPPEPGPRPPIVVDTPLGRLVLQGHTLSVGQPVTVLIHPDAARLAADCPSEGSILLKGTVREWSFRGGHYRLVLRHEAGMELAFELISETAVLPQRGEPITLALRSEAISVLAEESPEQA